MSDIEKDAPSGVKEEPAERSDQDRELAEWSLLASATAVMVTGSALTRASSPRR